VTLRVGWFTTGRGEGSRALFNEALSSIRNGYVDAQIAFVFCNRERGEHEATDGFLDIVHGADVPLVALSSRAFRRAQGGERSKPGQPLPAWRAGYDREVVHLLEEHPFDIGVLAGYMLIFTEAMSRRFPFLNLHPAAPDGPVGTWQEVIWQLIEARARRAGVMVHLATEELDRGPVVGYCTYSLRGPVFDPLWEAIGSRSVAQLRETEGEGNALFRTIRRHGVVREPVLVIEVLRALAGGRTHIQGRTVVDGDRRLLAQGLDLTPAVDAKVAPLN
jgi:folate-dependent phosphoribosylglycinamide formyltransferase PurN